MEKSINSNESLQILLLISDTLELDNSEISEALKKLNEHYKKESESAVRVKILSLIADISSEPNTDIPTVIEDVILLLKNESSHKAIAQAMSTLLKLGKLIKDTQVHQKIIEIAKNNLKDTNHSVKCKCLSIIGILTSITLNDELSCMLDLVSSYFDNDDARVRSQAFDTMITFHERGVSLKSSIYDNVCSALKDDYEIVRQVALKLICHIGKTYPEK